MAAIMQLLQDPLRTGMAFSSACTVDSSALSVASHFFQLGVRICSWKCLTGNALASCVLSSSPRPYHETIARNTDANRLPQLRRGIQCLYCRERDSHRSITSTNADRCRTIHSASRALYEMLKVRTTPRGHLIVATGTSLWYNRGV